MSRHFCFKHRLMALALTAALLPAAMPAEGQTLSEVQQEYNQLVALHNDTTTSREEFFRKTLLYSKHCQQALSALPRRMPDFKEVQKVMRLFYQNVRNGAAYYSQLQNDSMAVVFARDAIKVAMRPDMSDLQLRYKRDYSSLVYFLAAAMYNRAQAKLQEAESYDLFPEAIKYLREYKAVTDSSQHGRVDFFLHDAERLLSEAPDDKRPRTDMSEDAPDFDLFAGQAIREAIDAWKQKDPYETVAEFKERVNELTAQQRQKELQDTLLNEYVERFAHTLTRADMELKPYDADHESFLITSPYGDIVLTVPRSGNEARRFAENWDRVTLLNPNYVIANRKLALAGLSFATPSGKIYDYNNQQMLAYNETKVQANFASDLLDTSSLENSEGAKGNVKITKEEVVVGVPDVDINIPQTRTTNDNTFVAIFANEKYNFVQDVPMAANDGKMFYEYCVKTLGIPKEQVNLYQNASIGIMQSAIDLLKDMSKVLKSTGNPMRVIFYYAGHGIPNESTRDAFLLPVDADGRNTKVCLSLQQLYKDLADLGTQSVAFIDACFSGVGGDGKSLLAQARGVGIKAKAEKPTGNLIVFSAASDDETAYPYEGHGHGLFTYFLLKKLQDSKGNVSLGDLSDYISENVKQKSLFINHKLQSPTVSTAMGMEARWRKLKLK